MSDLWWSLMGFGVGASLGGWLLVRLWRYHETTVEEVREEGVSREVRHLQELRNAARHNIVRAYRAGYQRGAQDAVEEIEDRGTPRSDLPPNEQAMRDHYEEYGDG